MYSELTSYAKPSHLPPSSEDLFNSSFVDANLCAIFTALSKSNRRSEGTSLGSLVQP